MNKLILTKPTLIMMYGFPGSGKTFLARQLCEDLNAAHVQADRIRYELFDQPRFDSKENEIVNHLMNYMSEEFLNAGVSVVYDTNSSRLKERRELRDLVRKSKAESLLIWLQIDVESAFNRIFKRDRRKTDDHYANTLDRTSFESILSHMQNPNQTEDYAVISGKHNYHTQRNAVLRKLYDRGLLTTSDASSRVVKPGLVNLVPQPNQGRVDIARRNIIIR